MKWRNFLFAGVAALAVGTAAFAALAWQSALPPIDPPAAASFDPAEVKQGAVLATIGNCASCHSAPDKPPFAGGVPIETPFGAVYSTNITPDPDEGIGRWSEAAFVRAMRAGVDPAGRHLYPAFPYNHFTLVTDADDHALYAYLMTRQPAKTAIPPNSLVFPLNVRPLMAAWNLLFFRQGPYQPDPTRDARWNRGSYLVEGLGHCGACHTPHNSLGAERDDAHLGGGLAEGWNAYALDKASPAPIPWSVDALAFYLGHGWQAQHGVSRGPMAEVTANLAETPPADLTAMGTYLVDLMGVPSPERRNRARQLEEAQTPVLASATAGSQAPARGASDSPGGRIFVAACAACHSRTQALPFGGLDLRKSTALHAPDPTNIIIVSLNGLPAAPGEGGPIMPGFTGSLDERQLEDLLGYLRHDLAGEPPWPDLAKTIHDARTRTVVLHPSDGTSTAPTDTDVRASSW